MPFYKKYTNHAKKGFTIVELTIVILVLGILAGVSVVGYGQWQNQLSVKEVKSDLSAAASAMEDTRNFSTTGYPLDIPASFEARDRVTVNYVSGDSKGYCIEGRSNAVSGIYYFIDSAKKSDAVQGTCAGGEGATPDWTIFTYDTTLTGCTGLTVQLPITSPTSSAGSVIDWGDGSTQALSTTLQSHTYATAGEKTVKYKGPITTVNTTSIAAGNRPCLKEVRQWSEGISPTAMSFANSKNIQKVSAPPVSVKNMSNMFSGATTFNQNIGSWNTSEVTNMSGMFATAPAFNQNIGSWNTAKVTDMNGMFYAATAFNQNIGSWNTGNVTNMNNMFYAAPAFNQNIGSWNTGKVTNMNNMFYATNFNQNIASWNTSKVTDMARMFQSATVFNQNISGWDTSKVVDMTNMFKFATSFNQNLSGWNVGSVTTKPPSEFDNGATAWVLPKPTWT